MTATIFSQRRELAHRTSDGIEITLFWSRATDQVTIAVLDTRSDAALEFEVDGSAALDAFKHPYAYAATTRVRSVAPQRVAVPTDPANESFTDPSEEPVMYSPSLQQLLVQDHIEDLRRARQTRSTQPITTNERIAARHRHAVKLSACAARASERFVGRAVPEAFAF